MNHVMINVSLHIFGQLSCTTMLVKLTIELTKIIVIQVCMLYSVSFLEATLLRIIRLGSRLCSEVGFFPATVVVHQLVSML